MEEVVQPSAFKTFLNYVVKLIALIHQYIMSLNDSYGSILSDKQLHFIVVGCLGLFILFIVYPLFDWLVRNKLLVVCAWIFTFCILVAITLLIEIGQDYTGTGTMDFADIMSGLLGFIVMSVFGILAIKYWDRYRKKKEQEELEKEKKEQAE